MIKAEWTNKDALDFQSTVDKEGRVKASPVILVPNDYVQIVRCKDCKHYCPVYADTMGGRDCLLLKTITKADDYCSYGERKEEE